MEKWAVSLITCLAVLFVLSTTVSGTLRQFGQMLSRITNGKITIKRINGYGNYCGFKGSGTPRDNIDRCCKGHDECLSRSNIANCLPLHYFSFYLIPYRWSIVDKSIICDGSNNRCPNGLCICDAIAAVCLASFQDEYNPSLKGRGLFGR